MALRLIFSGFWMVSLLMEPQAFARENPLPGSQYTSARGAAMGGAQAPLADDGAGALFANPAAFGSARTAPHLEILNISGFINKDFMGSASSKSLGFTSLEKYGPGQVVGAGMPGAGATWVPNFSMYGIGFGVLLDSHISTEKPSADEIRYRSYYNFTPAIGTGVRLASGIIRLGYSAQWVSETKGDVYVKQDAEVLGYNQNLKEGAGLSHNVGFAFTLPYRYLPALNIVARNIGGLKYTAGMNYADNPSGKLDNLPMTIDMGLGSVAQIGNGAFFNYALEYKDATAASGVPMFGRLHFGTEFSFRNNFYLRAGWGNGYPSAGVGFARGKSELSLTLYTEDVGATYHEYGEVRYMLQYRLRVF